MLVRIFTSTKKILSKDVHVTWPSPGNLEFGYIRGRVVRNLANSQSVCPEKGPATVSPVMEFHTRIVSSPEPETMCRPSGENATELTGSVCPTKRPAAVSPVVAFHIRIVPSSEAEAMCWPSGDNATDMTVDPKFEIVISNDGQ